MPPSQAFAESRIDVASLVSGRNREPYVTITWGERKAQLTPAEARRHAQIILEAAEAAVSDAFLVSWLSERVQAPGELVGGLLSEFRAYRLAQEERDPVVAEADRHVH